MSYRTYIHDKPETNPTPTYPEDNRGHVRLGTDNPTTIDVEAPHGSDW